MFYLYLVAIIISSLAFISYGIFLVYSAISGKGLSKPPPESLFQFRVQYKFRGLIGAVFIFVGILILVGILKSY
jgi:uncharacterized membrane protein YkgB